MYVFSRLFFLKNEMLTDHNKIIYTLIIFRPASSTEYINSNASWSHSSHLSSLKDGFIIDYYCPNYFLGGNTFQNLNVSSPAPVTKVWPSGLIAKYNTLNVWPVNTAIFFIWGYFQTIISFLEYPWVETSSLTFFEYARLHTWLPVSTQWRGLHVRVFQNLIHLSAVPPPLHRCTAVVTLLGSEIHP